MDKSTPRSTSRVFVTSFENFDLVYIPSEQQVVSQFQGLNSFAWTQEIESSDDN